MESLLSFRQRVENLELFTLAQARTIRILQRVCLVQGLAIVFLATFMRGRWF